MTRLSSTQLLQELQEPTLLPTTASLRSRLIEWRKQRRYSQEQAAKLIKFYGGVTYSRSSLSQFEAGKHAGIEYDTARALLITMEKA